MRKLTLLLSVAALVAAAPATAAASAGEDEATKPDVVETAIAAGEFDTLVSLVKTARLARTLSGDGPFTVFAPTDAAFAKLPRSTLRSLKRDRAQLRRVLLYHVVGGRYRAARLTRAGSVPSLAGPRLQVRKRGRSVRVAGAKVVDANVGTSNGLIHVVDTVLVPPEG